jgi:hypothetical protein
VCNDTVSDAEALSEVAPDRPWPPSSTDVSWWHGETATLPVVPAEPAPDPPLAPEAFPLWSTDPAPAPARYRKPRHPAAGLTALLVLALLAGFFAWTSAEPLWLALGHAERGTATVTKCTGTGVLRRCVASFAGPATSVETASFVGADTAVGASVPARMVPGGGRIAYAGTDRSLVQRSALGLGLLVLCGLVIVWATGARRLSDRRARVGAFAACAFAPLLLFAGTLAATW